MPISDIPLDKAELLSMILEGILYGLSLPMFGGTIWALCSQRSTDQINRKLLTVACSLLLCSTLHIVIRAIRIVVGLVSYQDATSGGPIGYFSDISQWTFVCKNYVYTAQTLIGDGVVLYRCYAVWQSKLVMILPMLLWCTVAVTGIVCPYTESHTTQNSVFEGSLSRWIISFWAATLTTNLLAILLLAYRIGYADHRATSPDRKSQLQPVLRIVLDAGMIYSLTLFVALICFVNRSNSQYVVLDMITPIIAISFYMVIIRVGLANRANQTMNTLPSAYTANSVIVDRSSIIGDRRSRAQIHSTTFSENNVDNSRRSHMTIESSRRSQIKFDDIKEES